MGAMGSASVPLPAPLLAALIVASGTAHSVAPAGAPRAEAAVQIAPVGEGPEELAELAEMAQRFRRVQ